MPGGDAALERLVVDNARPDGSFPREAGGRLVEPHPGTFAKTLLELGVPRERAFTLPGGEVLTAGDLVAAAARGYTPVDADPRFKNEAWRLEALAGQAEVDATLHMRVAGLRQEALDVLVAEQAYLERFVGPDAPAYAKPFASGPDGRPRPAEIHRYFCGGLHFFQAVQRLHGAAVPAPLARQYELLLARIRLEDDYWREKLRQVAGRAQGPDLRRHREVILSQRLKLLGHALETIWRATDAGALELDDADRRVLADGGERLAEVVQALQDYGTYDDLDGVRARHRQVYLDLVGDSAHALHGLRLAD